MGVEITKEKIKKAFKKEDLVIQAINFLDELDKINNLFSERVREWYSLYFPELNHLIKDHQKFTQIISIICRKKEFKKEKLNKYVKNSIAKEIEKKSKESIGSKMNEEDLHIIKDLAEVSKNSYKLREETNNYIKRIIKEIAPNLNELAGPMLTARLIDLTGSLEKLSKLPSSTIQVIGAEKSLFKHLKGHAPSPKHGVIYMHSAIHSVPPSERGKIARKLANKICVAAKADYFTGNFLADELKEDLEKEIKELRK